MIEDGKHTGKVIGVEFLDDTFNEGGIVASIDVDLGEATVTCRHRTHGEHGDKTLDLLEGLGYPRELKSLTRISELVGTEVTVKLKTSPAGRQNAYLNVGRSGKVLDTDEINRRLSGADDALPF